MIHILFYFTPETFFNVILTQLVFNMYSTSGQNQSVKNRCNKCIMNCILCLLMLKDHFSNKRVIVNTDNKDLVSVISKKTSKEKMIMPLVRELVLHTMNCNIMLQVRHVRGLNNGICDALSRGNFQRFRELAPSMPEEPLPIPRHLLPSAMLGRLMLK